MTMHCLRLAPRGGSSKIRCSTRYRTVWSAGVALENSIDSDLGCTAHQ
jgi:hypothetical protein